jgi:P27 family predicted phage terminase small subunit
MTTPAAQRPKIPRVPKTITTPEGKELWKMLWQAKADQIIAAQDTFIIQLICETQETITRMKGIIDQEGDTMTINNGATYVLHPLHKQITDLTKQMTDLLRALGFSPADRAKLQVETNKGAANKFDEFRKRLNGGA